MIIRPGDDGLQCITQPDHAHLSRQVMEHCAALRTHPRAVSILLAVGEHDNGWAEPDAAPIIDPTTGRPFDFVSAPLHVRHDVWPRGVARLARDPWAAGLVANHAVTVYDRYRDDRAWDAFFAQMETLRADMLRVSGGGFDDLRGDYPFVRLGDLISLVFCTGWSEEQRFAEWTVTRSGADVIVTPYPFDVDPIAVEITGRKIPAQRYRDDTDLRAKLKDAPLSVLRGVVRRAGR